ncbi:similar to Saccharomyces cerevisiae YOL042W NGL1 Putative endonuclease, has a domain similar to a magnesium-dependent endonuclease motif in mRNA deadenylase Ccr4p [Maudiozyma saulgeensis]|uniref:Similar to Saccharomyces cerevisiae YOL042W NGL1 Putative endonuclease, has a domain similar to a magnesium-dependent endonuclease motif in mRNA deadenylase Ccr4p n=1 Tax=Maudiozyma saulgeensis TaxID=1789683 RepID=A0A1X7R2Y5_9SACH|nr:similar to Saccharomyces cerevisiae YOL042W NGL1 Putative endonuclease, has a domain similar to a magnesium-dependent endonuclease motif in mRNA deadenylase Ccr4p [Kazachstania saulgeensis]
MSAFCRRFIPVKPVTSWGAGKTTLRELGLPGGNVTKNEIDNNRFTMLTYNILSPAYMWPQVYTYVPEKFKDWRYRHNLLERELFQTYKSDIMCLQELTIRDYNNFWKNNFLEKYKMGSEYISKTAPTYWKGEKDQLDGVGIFYNLEKFEFIHSTGIKLSEYLNNFNKHELGFLAKKQMNLTDGTGKIIGQSNLLDVLTSKNQVCLFVSLRHKPTGTAFVVINTHLYWKYDDVKLSQCMVIMRELDKIINKIKENHAKEGRPDQEIKILFTGDLNSTGDSLVINFLKGQILNTNSLNMLNPMRTNLNHCVYDDIVKENLFDYTCYSGKLKGIFDYIWYHDTDFQLTKILSGKEVTEELETHHQFGLPNETHPSDHIPLVAEFELLRTAQQDT